MYAAMRAKGPKADLALITCDTDAVTAGVFTTNVMAAAPVAYCREVLARTDTTRAVRHRWQTLNPPHPLHLGVVPPPPAARP